MKSFREENCSRWVLLRFQRFIVLSYFKYTSHMFVLRVSESKTAVWSHFTPFLEVYDGDVMEAKKLKRI